MFFSNATFFLFPISVAASFQSLEAKLNDHPLKPLGPLELERNGFVSPLGEDTQALHHRIGDAIWLTLGSEYRTLPADVVNRAVSEKLKALEKATGQMPGARARKALKDEIILDLLPKAFIQRRRLNACVLLKHGVVVIDTASRKSAEMFISELRHALGSFPAMPINMEISARTVLTGWLAGDQLPEEITLNEECELKEADAQGAIVRCQRQELLSDEITKLIESGKQCTRLGVLFHQNISGVVDETMSIRKLKFLDGALEQLDGTAESMQDELDARFVLFSGEITKVFESISTAFKFSSVEPMPQALAA